MGRFGCLLILVAVAALMVIVVLPVLPPFEDDENIDNMLIPLLCQPGEGIERDLYSEPSREGGTSYSMDVYCIDKEDDRRDETGRWVLTGVVAFIVPFLIGLAMVIGAANRGARNVLPTAVPYPEMGQMNYNPPPVTPSPNASLSDKLKQLEDARNQGLINADEYDRLRREILDKM